MRLPSDTILVNFFSLRTSGHRRETSLRRQRVIELRSVCGALACAGTFATSAVLVRREKPFEHHANRRLFVGVQKRRCFEGQLKRLIVREPIFAAKDERVATHRESDGQLAKDAECRFRLARLVSTDLIGLYSHPFGESHLGQPTLAAQFGKLFRKSHHHTLVLATLGLSYTMNIKHLKRLVP
jgi:hypothetical protein